MKFGKEFMLFIKACRHYGLMKDGNKTQMNRDAKIIGNNMGLDNIDF
jgi:hypothetical protein